jgi:hemerythrin
MKHKEEARIFCEAIEKIAQKPHNIENLESYLSYHFAEWIEKHANTPENIAAELKQFAEMAV